MTPDLLEIFFALLRLSLDAEGVDSVVARLKQHPLTTEDWKNLYKESDKQTIVGVMLVGIHKLPEDLLPPDEILDDWTSDAFYIHQANDKMNRMCAKVTRMFMERGLHPIILKGQANATLYPDPYSRQPGDIDIFVEGGKKNVIRHLTQMGLMKGAETSSHHVHLDPKQFDGISVEVHFQPVACMPLGPGRRLLKYLYQTADFTNCKLNPAGFYEPPMEFALAMQLSHIRRHFIGEGVGLRQLVDYFLLLRNSPAETRVSFSKKLKELGLLSISSAVMYPLKHLLNLGEEELISTPDEKWGEKLRNLVLNGGNFGKAVDRENESLAEYWLHNRKNALKLSKFDFAEAVWYEINYWKTFLAYTPRRIKQRKLSFRHK